MHEIANNPNNKTKKGLKTNVLIEDLGLERVTARFFRSSRLRRGRLSFSMLFCCCFADIGDITEDTILLLFAIAVSVAVAVAAVSNRKCSI